MGDIECGAAGAVGKRKSVGGNGLGRKSKKQLNRIPKHATNNTTQESCNVSHILRAPWIRTIAIVMKKESP